MFSLHSVCQFNFQFKVIVAESLAKGVAIPLKNQSNSSQRNIRSPSELDDWIHEQYLAAANDRNPAIWIWPTRNGTCYARYNINDKEPIHKPTDCLTSLAFICQGQAHESCPATI